MKTKTSLAKATALILATILSILPARIFAQTLDELLAAYGKASADCEQRTLEMDVLDRSLSDATQKLSQAILEEQGMQSLIPQLEYQKFLLECALEDPAYDNIESQEMDIEKQIEDILDNPPCSMEKMQEMIDELNAELDTLRWENSCLGDMQNELDSVNAQLDKANGADVAAAQAEVDAIQTDIGNKSRELEEISGQKESLKAQIEAMGGTVNE